MHINTFRHWTQSRNVKRALRWWWRRLDIGWASDMVHDMAAGAYRTHEGCEAREGETAEDKAGWQEAPPPVWHEYAPQSAVKFTFKMQRSVKEVGLLHEYISRYTHSFHWMHLLLRINHVGQQRCQLYPKIRLHQLGAAPKDDSKNSVVTPLVQYHGSCWYVMGNMRHNRNTHV